MAARTPFLAALALLCFAALARADTPTPKEAVGFWGQVTGTVKSAQPDGLAFVLTVTTAVIDEKTSALKDASGMPGKDLTIGARMPRNNDNVPAPNPVDVAYIKTLKAGQEIKAKIFAVRTDPTILRLQFPGENVPAASQPATKP